MARLPKWLPFAVGAAAIGTVIGVVVSANRASAKSAPTPSPLPPPSSPPSAPTMLTPILTPVSPGMGLFPTYLVKYTADALQIIATPAQGKPVMLCSYYPYYVADATDLTEAQAHYTRLKFRYETATEELYRQHGRRWITRLRKRFFDPKTFKELPGDTIAQSNNLFSVPIYTSDTPGVPCG